MNPGRFTKLWLSHQRLQSSIENHQLGKVHHLPDVGTRSTARRRLSWASTLYALALLVAIYGIARVILDFSDNSLGYLAGLVGVFTIVGAGIQQITQQRNERSKDRRQAEQDSLRRFDERFSVVTQGLASGDARQKAGSGAALMSFLQEGNSAFYQQTYYYLLAHLKATKYSGFDRTVLRAFECAAHLVLPSLAEATNVLGPLPRTSAGSARKKASRVNKGVANARKENVTANKKAARPPNPPRGPRERRLAVDFSGARLDGIDLAFLELSEADLSRTKLTHADLSSTCLWRAHGDGTNLSNTSLRHANLEEVVFRQLISSEADFTGANLVAARFAARNATFSRGDMSGRSILRHAQFVRARLQGACLNGADLRDARFDGANIKGASFHGALLNRAAKLTILRTVSESWRKAEWDWDVEQDLKRLAATPRRSRMISPRRRAAHLPATYYRNHPYPGHQDPAPRIRSRSSPRRTTRS